MPNDVLVKGGVRLRAVRKEAGLHTGAVDRADKALHLSYRRY